MVKIIKQTKPFITSHEPETDGYYKDLLKYKTTGFTLVNPNSIKEKQEVFLCSPFGMEHSIVNEVKENGLIRIQDIDLSIKEYGVSVTDLYIQTKKER